MIEVRSTAISVIALRWSAQGAEVLLMRRVYAPKGAWCQVAGKVEQGETGWQAGLRELREETGLIPQSYWSGDICEQFYEAKQNVISILPVFVAIVAEDAKRTLCAEHDAAEWLGFDAARARVSFVGQRRVLDAVEQGFVLQTPSEDLRIS